MVANTRVFDFVFDASTSRMAAGMQAGKQALQDVTNESKDANVALRAMPEDVRVGFEISEASAAKLRAELEGQVAAIEASLGDVNVDVDTKKAVRELKTLKLRLLDLDKMDVRPEVHVDRDRTMAAAMVATQGLSAGMRAVGSAGPIAAAGIATVAAAAGLALAPAAIGGLTAALVGGGAYSLLSAYDELEKGNKRFAVVFGKQSATVDKWARGLSERVGVGVEDLKGMAAGIQDILVPIGFNRADAADLTRQLYERGAALAEFNGIEVGVAIDAITKGLTGERESLKQFGVVLKETQVSARVEQLRGTEAAKGFDDQQLKALATMELIEEQSEDSWKAWTDGTNLAGLTLNQLTVKWANFKDDVILGLGKIAVGIIRDLDFGGMTSGLDDVSGWITANGPAIRSFMIDMAIMAIDGALAFVSMGQNIVDMAVAAAPMLSGLSKVMGFASANALRLAAGLAAMAGTHGLAASLLESANGAQALADSTDEALQTLIGFGARSAPGLETAKEKLEGIKSALEGVRANPDLVLTLNAQVAMKEWKAAEATMAELTKKDIKKIIANIPEEDRSKAENKLLKLARKRLAEIKAEAETDGAEKKFKDMTRKERRALIKVGKEPTSWDKLQREFSHLLIGETKWITVRYNTDTGGARPASDLGWNRSLPGAGAGGAGGGTTVILDGERVASVVARRTSQQHREVWV